MIKLLTDASAETILQQVHAIAGTLDSLSTSEKSNLVAALNEVLGKIGSLSSLGTTAKGSAVAAINEVNSGKNTNATSIGTLSSLGTSAKTNLVAAINEVNTGRGTNATAIGTLSSLGTSAKGNLVAAVNEVNTAVSGIFNLNTVNGTGIHNSIYRAMNLGTSVTSAQWTAIKDATYTGMWIGSYWDIDIPAYTWTDSSGTVHNESAIGTLRFYIAAFDYGLRFRGGSYMTKHHILVIPQKSLYPAQMNSTATTAGGFIGSEMYKNNLRRAEAIFTAAFGAAHLYAHDDFLSNAVTDGKISGGAWTNVKVGLMTEAMLTGGYSRSENTIMESMGNCRLPLFMYVPPLRLATEIPASARTRMYWLAHPGNATQWTVWTGTNHIALTDANKTEVEVRPYALLYQA